MQASCDKEESHPDRITQKDDEVRQLHQRIESTSKGTNKNGSHQYTNRLYQQSKLPVPLTPL